MHDVRTRALRAAETLAMGHGEGPFPQRGGTVSRWLVLALLLMAAGCGNEGGSGATTTADSARAGDTTSATDNAGGSEDVAADSGAATAPTDAQAGGDTATAPAPTWHKDVAPIVLDRCGSCHSAGGIAPFVLDEAEAWSAWGKVALGAMKEGRMPPWPPAQGCGEFLHPLRMDSAEVDTIAAWLDAGRPLGDPKDAPATTTPIPALKPTHSLPMPQAYMPNAGISDDYRCFFLDLDTSADLYVRGTQVRPGANALVHHVLVYALEGDMITKAQAADAKDETPGYTCFGSPLPSGAKGGSILGFTSGFPNQIAAWVPGLSPRLLPKEMALRIPKGSKVVMQVHYNLSAGKPEADTTTLDLIADHTPPDRVLATRPLIIESLKIPAGQTEVVQKRTYRYYGGPEGEVRIHSLTPHMHLLGTRFAAEIVRKDGTTECALQIPKWDFAWQMGYGRPVDKPIVLKNGDGMTIECVFDNSKAHQPTVNGVQQEPKDVTWGEGTTDEMCLLYLDMSEPFKPTPPEGSAPCLGFDTCAGDCGTSPSTCIYSCAEVAPTCGTCAIGQIVSCAGMECAGSLLSAQSCLTNCMIGSLMLGSNADACLGAECASAWSKAKDCIDPKLASGKCDAKLANCGLSFGAK